MPPAHSSRRAVDEMLARHRDRIGLTKPPRSVMLLFRWDDRASARKRRKAPHDPTPLSIEPMPKYRGAFPRGKRKFFTGAVGERSWRREAPSRLPIPPGSRPRSSPRSAIVEMLVLAETIVGMTEASTARSLLHSRTRHFASTTAAGSSRRTHPAGPGASCQLGQNHCRRSTASGKSSSRPRRSQSIPGLSLWR